MIHSIGIWAGYKMTNNDNSTHHSENTEQTLTRQTHKTTRHIRPSPPPPLSDHQQQLLMYPYELDENTTQDNNNNMKNNDDTDKSNSQDIEPKTRDTSNNNMKTNATRERKNFIRIMKKLNAENEQLRAEILKQQRATTMTTTKFLPAKPPLPNSNLSTEELQQMDESSDDDAIPAATLSMLIQQMSMGKRLETISWLEKIHRDDGHFTPNPVIGVLNNKPPPRDDSKHMHTDRRTLDLIDRALQRDVRRKVQKLRKWERAKAKSETEDTQAQHQRQKPQPSTQQREQALLSDLIKLEFDMRKDITHQQRAAKYTRSWTNTVNEHNVNTDTIERHMISILVAATRPNHLQTRLRQAVRTMATTSNRSPGYGRPLNMVNTIFALHRIAKGQDAENEYEQQSRKTHEATRRYTPPITQPQSIQHSVPPPARTQTPHQQMDDSWIHMPTNTGPLEWATAMGFGDMPWVTEANKNRNAYMQRLHDNDYEHDDPAPPEYIDENGKPRRYDENTTHNHAHQTNEYQQ